MTCSNTVAINWGGEDYELPCGAWHNGDKLFCAACEKRLHKAYPQGWRAYPGDVCKHGVYVGGCGVDWMCGRCEMGG
jgi:hypothetical protein